MRRECAAALVSLLLPFPLLGALRLAGVPAEGPAAYATMGWFAAASIFLTLRSRRPLSDLGLTRRNLLPSLLLSSFLLVAVLLGALTGSGVALREPLAPLRLFERALYCFGFSAPGQELMFRGLILFAFLRWKGPVAAVAASAFLYGLAHVRGGTAGMAANAAYGVFYALVVWRTRNLWGPIVVHGLYNFLFGYLLHVDGAVL